MAVIVDFYFRQYLTTIIQTASNMKGATFLVPTCTYLRRNTSSAFVVHLVLVLLYWVVGSALVVVASSS